MNKYKITAIEHPQYPWLHRIQALIDVNEKVPKGTIGGFVDTNDLDGLKKYYKDLVKDCQHVNSIALLNPNVINNGGIYNLLMTKYKKAQELKVKIGEYFDENED